MFRAGWLAWVLLVATASAMETRLLTDFRDDVPRDLNDCTLRMRLIGVRPLPGGGSGDVVIELQRRDGAWDDSGHRAFADYNQVSQGAVQLDDLRWDGNRVVGRLRATIEPDRPRPGGKDGFPSPPDRFELEIDATIEPGVPADFVADSQAFLPPWRRDTPSLGGERVTGTFKGRLRQVESSGKALRDEAVEGRIVGGAAMPARSGRFSSRGGVLFGPADDGVRTLVRLSPTRVSPPHGASIVKFLAEPIDLRHFDGLRITVSSETRRDEVGVSVGLRESGGAWYSVRNAALLLGRRAHFDVPFSDFRHVGGFDDSYFLELDRVTAISVGVDNAHGVGDVRFAVHSIELYRDSSDDGRREEPVLVEVGFNRRLSVNGVSEVPKGLFGFHDVHGDSAPDQPRTFEEMRRLNPGFLRPLSHVGFGGKPLSDEELRARIERRLANPQRPTSVLFRRAEAGNAIDNIVWCHTTDLWNRPPWMDADLPTFLAGVRHFYRNLAADAWVPGDEFNLLRRVEVWNEPFMWGRHVNMGKHNPPGRKAWTDDTQYGYLPGKLGADMWSDTFLAAVEGARAVNPHLKLGGPSAPAFNDDDFGCFTNYVQRILDRCHDQLDFLTEHHYQGQPDSFAASYLVATAYLDTRHGKRISIYNTEANDLVDAPTRGAYGEPPPWHRDADQLNRAHYNIEDILTCLRVAPDLVAGRAMHCLVGGFCSNPGETHAYELLATLRGAMLPTRSSEPRLLAAASMPRAGRTVVVLFNDSPRERRFRLPLPAGAKLVESLALRFDNGTKLVASSPTDGDVIESTLPPRGGLRLTFDVPVAETQPTRVETSFADLVLAKVSPEQPATGRVVWRGAGHAGASRAWLRIVTSDVHRDEGLVRINGHELPLPWSSSNDGCAVAQDIPIDPGWLSEQTTLEFRVRNPAAANGFVVCAALVVLER